MEEGLQSLNDFVIILKFYRSDMKEEIYTKLEIKAYYWAAVIFYKARDYE